MEKKDTDDLIEKKGKKKTKKKSMEKPDYCTTAPSAEQARAHNDDEPCDDGREGKVD